MKNKIWRDLTPYFIWNIFNTGDNKYKK